MRRPDEFPAALAQAAWLLAAGPPPAPSAQLVAFMTGDTAPAALIDHESVPTATSAGPGRGTRRYLIGAMRRVVPLGLAAKVLIGTGALAATGMGAVHTLHHPHTSHHAPGVVTPQHPGEASEHATVARGKAPVPGSGEASKPPAVSDAAGEPDEPDPSPIDGPEQPQPADLPEPSRSAEVSAQPPDTSNPTESAGTPSTSTSDATAPDIPPAANTD